MKRIVLLFFVLTSFVGYAQELTVSDIQDSGCLRDTRGESKTLATVILKKEGNILSVELQNYVSNCCTDEFVAKASMGKGNNDAPDSLLVNVNSVVDNECDCTCKYNVSLTVRDIETNSFYLNCWWYDGLVELTDGEPLVLEDIREEATVSGMKFLLHKTLHKAMLEQSEWADEVSIPEEVTYNGQTYRVTSIEQGAFTNCTTLTKVNIPRTIVGIIDYRGSISFAYNPFFGCTALESIEVDEDNPVLCSVNGILFNKDKTNLISYPAGASRAYYTLPEGVNWIAGNSFAFNQNLKKVTLPDGMTELGYRAFYNSKILKEVKLPSGLKTLTGSLFENCQRLQSVTIPQSVTSICYYAFKDCTALSTLDIPESVTMIDFGTFSGCSFNALYIRGFLDSQYIKGSLFNGMDTKARLYVPQSEVYKYQAIYKGSVYSLPNQTVDITEVTPSTDPSAPVYDLQGRRIQGEPVKKGVYLRGGKKYVRK